TQLVHDDHALEAIDAELAQKAAAWGPLSVHKVEQAIDLLIDRHDPGARRRTRASARGRDVCIGAHGDNDLGTTALWGRLYSTDAAFLDRRLTQMAQGVCDADPRTIAQRRADALGALAGGAEHLRCTCGRGECPANALDTQDQPASRVLIHVVAEQAALRQPP